MLFRPHLHPEYYEYTVRPGDTLSGILHKMYGVGSRDASYKNAIALVQQLNPHIHHPDRIRAGDILRLTESLHGCSPFSTPTPPDPRKMPGGGHLISERVPRTDREAYWALSWLQHNSEFLTVPGAVAFGGGANLLSGGNIQLIQSVAEAHAEYRAGTITKGQYDYRRRVAVNRLRMNLGPAERWLFDGKTTRQSIRIARAGGVPVTADINRHAQRLKHLSQLARVGGIMLAGVGLTAACRQIANEADQGKKNDILVESVSSTAVGGVLGLGVGLFLVSNPVGWGTALVLAAGTAAWGFNAGKLMGWMYEVNGRQIDFATETGVGKLCQ